MTVKKLSKKSRKQKKPLKEDEELIELFISAGGKTTEESRNGEETSEESLSRFTLRMPKPFVTMIDTHRKTKVGNVSRNTWILEAIANKLKHDD